MPACSLAMTHLGRPLPGASLLGGFAALNQGIGLDYSACRDKWPFSGSVAEGSVEAARAAFRLRARFKQGTTYVTNTCTAQGRFASCRPRTR